MDPSTITPFDAAAVFFVALVFFLICREIICWYWKVNEGVALLREIRDSLQMLTGKPDTPLERIFGKE